jgi:hypothetical protein
MTVTATPSGRRTDTLRLRANWAFWPDSSIWSLLA